MKRLLIGLCMALCTVSVVGFERAQSISHEELMTNKTTSMLSHAFRNEYFHYEQLDENTLHECYEVIQNIISDEVVKRFFTRKLSREIKIPISDARVVELAQGVREQLEINLIALTPIVPPAPVRPAGPRVNMSRLNEYLKAQNNNTIEPYQVNVPSQAIQKIQHPQVPAPETLLVEVPEVLADAPRPPLLANDNALVKRSINAGNSWLIQLNCVDQASEGFIRANLFNTCPMQALRAASLAVQSLNVHDLDGLRRLTSESHAINFIRTVRRNGNDVSDLVDREIAQIMQTPLAQKLITQNVLNRITLIDTITSFEITRADTPLRTLERVRRELTTSDSYCHAFIVSSNDVGQYLAMKQQGQEGGYAGGADRQGPIMHWFTYVVYKHNNQVHYFVIDSLSGADHTSGINYERFKFFQSVLEQGYKQENLRRYQATLEAYATDQAPGNQIDDLFNFADDQNDASGNGGNNFWQNPRLAQASFVAAAALGMWKLYDIFKK